MGAFYEAFEPNRARSYVRRIDFCFTPKHGSWLNIAETELSSMTRQSQRGVDWRMKINDARYKLKSVYPKIQS
jgi:hypothetical protein